MPDKQMQIILIFLLIPAFVNAMIGNYNDAAILAICHISYERR